MFPRIASILYMSESMFWLNASFSATASECQSLSLLSVTLN